MEEVAGVALEEVTGVALEALEEVAGGDLGRNPGIIQEGSSGQGFKDTIGQ
ncbi:hypothetical protein JW826_06165 [Candidatus Woesearchaeota archaeon]|nr:hypothetical protein [Candidatus Woesearchaeota archaeon]